MPLYSKVSKDLVYDLITQGNPSLPYPITPTSATLGSPVVIPVVGPSIANTRIKLTAAPNSAYIGNRQIDYRRIDVSSLFKNALPNLVKYSAAGDAGNSPFTLYSVLAALNALTGLTLNSDDIADAAFPAYSTITENGKQIKVSSLSLTIKATSLAFVGTFTVRTQGSKRELSSILTLPEINGRTFPGGNVFDANHKVVLSMDGFGGDYSPIMEEKVLYTQNGTYIPVLQFFADAMAILEPARTDVWDGHKVLVARLATMTGTPYVADSTTLGNVKYNLRGATVNLVTLPNAAYPLANSTTFNRLMVIKPSVQNQEWCAGTLFLHYNV